METIKTRESRYKEILDKYLAKELELNLDRKIIYYKALSYVETYKENRWIEYTLEELEKVDRDYITASIKLIVLEEYKLIKSISRQTNIIRVIRSKLEDTNYKFSGIRDIVSLTKYNIYPKEIRVSFYISKRRSKRGGE